MKKAPEYSCILFDLDGTLADPGPGITDSVQYALRQLGIEEDDQEKLRRFVGPPLETTFKEEYGFDMDKAWEAVGFYREYFSETGIKEYQVYPGVPELLKELKNTDRTLAVATSKIQPYAEKILSVGKIDGYFDEVSARDPQVTEEKEATIRRALTNLGVEEKGNVVMVGDKEHDLIGAHANGIDGIGVLYGYGTRQELAEHNPSAILKTVEDLREYLS